MIEQIFAKHKVPVYMFQMFSRASLYYDLKQITMPTLDIFIILVFFTCDSIYAKHVYAMAIPSVRLSVCLSVRLSHGWISQKRLKLGSRNFHHTVAPSL